MKFILPLLFLVSCSSVSQKEPWRKDDCVEWTDRPIFAKIVDKPFYGRSTNPDIPYEYFYTLKIIKKSKKPKLIMKRIDCDSIPKE